MRRLDIYKLTESHERKAIQMLDTTRTFYFGSARDIEDYNNSNTPARCPFAVGDIVYYYEPDNRTGKIAEVQGWHYNEDGNVRVNIKITATGEELDAPLGRVRP